MTPIQPPVNSYSDTSVNTRVIGTGIHLIDPVDTPLLARWGYDGARGKFDINANGTKIEIIEDVYPTLTGHVEVEWAQADTTGLGVNDASNLTPGMVLSIDGGVETVVVKSVDVAGATIDVYARGFGGVDAARAVDKTWEVVGMARLEGSDATFNAVEPLTQPFNYTSIFQHGLKMTGTELAIDKLYSEDEFNRQSLKAIKVKNILLEKMLFHGIRAIGSATAPRSFGGFDTFITTNVTGSVGAIAKADVELIMENAYGYGANPNLFICNPAIASDLRALIDTSSFVRVGQDNTRLGMSAIGTIVTQYGSLEILPDRHCPLSKAYFIDERKVGLYTLRPWQWYPLAHAGDYKSAELIGEFSFLVANDKAHGALTGLTS